MGFPTTLSKDDLEAYGLSLIKVLIGFGVVGIILTISLMIAKCVIKRSEAKPLAKHSVAGKILSFVLLVIAIVSCALAWSYNAQFTNNLQASFSTLQNVATNTDNVVLSLNGSLIDLKADLNFQIQRAVDLVNNLSTILTPVDNAINLLPGTITDVLVLQNDTQVMITNMTIVRSDLVYLNEKQSEGEISGVPPPSAVPSIDSSFTQSLDNSILNVQQINEKLNNVTNNVNSTISDISQNQLASIEKASSDYTSQADSLSSLLTDAHVTIQSAIGSFNIYSGDANKYNTYRYDVTAAILVLPIVFAAILALSNLCNVQRGLTAGSWLCFTFLFWYIVIAGVNYVLYQATTDFCASKDQVISSLLATESNITVNGLNHTIDLQTTVPLILYCMGNTNLIGILDADYLIDDLNGKVSTQTDAIANETNRLNVTADYVATNNYIDTFLNQTAFLNYTQGTNVSQVQDQVNAVNEQVNDLNRFNFSYAAYNASLASVNAITTDLQRNNGTVIHNYYDQNNITTLKCRQSPYDDIDQSVQDNLCNSSAVAITMTNQLNQITNDTNQIRNTALDVSQRLQGFINTYNEVATVQQEISFFVCLSNASAYSFSFGQQP
jgi:hypothetical protein